MAYLEHLEELILPNGVPSAGYERIDQCYQYCLCYGVRSVGCGLLNPLNELDYSEWLEYLNTESKNALYEEECKETPSVSVQNALEHGILVFWIFVGVVLHVRRYLVNVVTDLFTFGDSAIGITTDLFPLRCSIVKWLSVVVEYATQERSIFAEAYLARSFFLLILHILLRLVLDRLKRNYTLVKLNDLTHPIQISKNEIQ